MFDSCRLHRCVRSVVLIASALYFSSPARADDDVIDAHIKALGGAEAVAKVKTIQRSGTAKLEGDFGQFEGSHAAAYVVGKKAYTKLDFDLFVEQNGWNGESGWKLSSQGGLTEVVGDDLEGLKMQAAVSPIVAIAKQYGRVALKDLGERELDDKKYLGIGIVDSMVVFYLDPQTKLIAAMTVAPDDAAAGGEATVKVSYDDYQEHGGVKVPDTVVIEIADGAFTIEMAYDETTINDPVDETLFESPEE